MSEPQSPPPAAPDWRRGYHDIGGLPAGPIDPSSPPLAGWEKRIHALSILLFDKSRGIMTVDELRRGVESMGRAEYEQLSYYERWIVSMTDHLLLKGVITPEELGRKLAEIEAREAAL